MLPWWIMAVLIGIALLIIWIIWKIVTTPNVVLTVVTDKATYNRGETVHISGILTGDGDPVAGQTITGSIVLPGGGGAHNFTAVTAADGSYTSDYDTAGAAGGTYTIQVTGFGAQASATFTQIVQMRVSVLMA